MVVYNRLRIGSKSSLLPKASCWFITFLWLEETAGTQVYWSIALGTHGSISQPRLHRDTYFRRYLQEKKAHCNLFGQELRTGAADTGLCWQKEPGTSIEREGQQYSYGQHQTPLASPCATARAPAAPVSPWPTTRDRDAGSAALNLTLLTLRLSSFLFLLLFLTSRTAHPHSNSQSAQSRRAGCRHHAVYLKGGCRELGAVSFPK